MNYSTLFFILTLPFIFLFETIFPHFKERHNRITHGTTNILIAIINYLLYAVVFSGLTVAVIRWAERHDAGILRLGEIPSMITALGAFILFDVWMYYWHRANHVIPFLWRFHRVHHIDREMDVTTALRFHPGEVIFSSCLRLIIFLVIGLDLLHILMYETCLHVVIMFHHSNIAVPEEWDRIMRFLIVTPNMHRVHHSDIVNETNSNYASIFSFWDRLHRSFRKREDTHTLTLGLRQYQHPQWRNMGMLLLCPFR